MAPSIFYNKACFGVFAILAITVALFAVLASFIPALGSLNAYTGSDELVVDLGYQLNSGQSVVDDTLVTFRNIRFAAPPVGPLRFLAPKLPAVNRSRIQNASDVICPQAFPKWLITGAVTPFTPADIPPVDPRTSEDCLFLDVLLPKSIWDTRKSSRAPVLVWIFGGGFDIGWKDASGRGYGLVTRSQRFGSEGLILVSINYRLGLFGWMNGEGVTSNAGLLDQRSALAWVQRYIHLFGGDPNQATIIGESAGGSSVEAHTTAYGGTKGSSPFKAAIVQSPYILPTHPLPNSKVDAVLRYGNVAKLDDLRRMLSADLQRLNALLIGNSQPFGSFTFGIVPDNDYVPDLPGRLLERGCFDQKLSMMTGHNQDEGSRFIPNKLVTSDAAYSEYLQFLIRPLSTNVSALNVITQTLYPAIFDGSQGYTTQTERNNLTIADAIFVCNTRFLNQAAFRPTTYAYQWSVPSGVHGADLPYTFYDFDPVPGVNTTVAEMMQGYFARFAITGQPNAPSLPRFAPAKSHGIGTVQNLGNDGVGPMPDEGGTRQLKQRCQFWQEVPYLNGYEMAEA